MSTLHCLYRISSNSYKKERIEGATKEACLHNFLTQFQHDDSPITIVADSLDLPTRMMLLEFEDVNIDIKVEHVNIGKNAQSFKYLVDKAITLPPDDYVYLVEDDYLHRTGSRTALLEGLERSAYVSLYAHPDKVLPASKGGNPFIDDDGGEVTKLYLTRSTYWTLTNSTTCTFACKVSTLKEDYETWKQWCFINDTQTHPHDFQTFLALREHGRSLITPVPAYSTHCDKLWLAPLIDWTECL